jgi:hypothetical protein
LNLLLYFTAAYENMCLKRSWALLSKPDPSLRPWKRCTSSRPEKARLCVEGGTSP